MELIGIKDIMELLQVSRREADRIASLPGCPCLPRVKGGKVRIQKEAFLEWIKGGCQ